MSNEILSGENSQERRAAEEKTYDDVRAAFNNGTVLNTSRKELEQLLLANARASLVIQHRANLARASEMGETMRQLLAARQSEEIQNKSAWIAIIALVVAIAALFCSAVQVYYAFAGAHRAAAPPPALNR